MYFGKISISAEKIVFFFSQGMNLRPTQYDGRTQYTKYMCACAYHTRYITHTLYLLVNTKSSEFTFSIRANKTTILRVKITKTATIISIKKFN